MSDSSNRVAGSVQGPQGFRKLSLKHTYVTGNYDLACEFFMPLLSNAVSYDRGVGYFSSGWLQVNRLLTEAGISNLPYTSEESASAKQTALDQLRRNDVQAVIAVKCLDEGIDVPQVHQAILLASNTRACEIPHFVG